LMADHSGTHIDALCHQASNLKLFGGIKVSRTTETPWGFKKLAAESIKPIIGRGVLIDVAEYNKNPVPELGEIERGHCDVALRDEGVKVRPKDIVFIRTGYGKYWNHASRYERAPGVAKDVSLWLAAKGVSAVGCDNLTWDHPNRVDPETRSSMVGHLHLLVGSGIYIMEKVYLEELSRDRVFEFLFVGLPLKFVGATGSPLRPIAIVPKTKAGKRRA
jgi:kynurenine formamidase